MMSREMLSSKFPTDGHDGDPIVAEFQKYDENADGTISFEDLSDVLQKLDPGYFTDARARHLMRELQAEHDSRIDYGKFVKWINEEHTAEVIVNETAANVSAPARSAASRRRSPAAKRRSGSSSSRVARKSTSRDGGTSEPSQDPSEGGRASRQPSPAREPSARTPSPKHGSQVARLARLQIFPKLPSHDAPGAWTQLEVRSGSELLSDLRDGFTSKSELEQLRQAGEWVLLDDVQPLPKDQAFDVIAGRPLSEMLPASQTAREEGWVTCSWSERRASKTLPDGSSTGNVTGDATPPSGTEPDAVAAVSLAAEDVEDADPAAGAAASLEARPGSSDDCTESQMKELQVKVVTQMEEMNLKGRLRLFSQTSLVPECCQIWWRVGPRTTEGFRSDELLDVVIQSLDVDDAALVGGGGDSKVDTLEFLKPHQRKSASWMAAREQSAEPFIADWHTTRPLHWEFSASLSKAPTRWAEDRDERKASRSGPSRASLGDGFVALQLEYRMENVYEIHGGVLADPIGSGKTATCLSHVACSHGAALPSSMSSSAWHHDYLVPLDCTLILCPETVHHQWMAEVHKWPELESVIEGVAVNDAETLLRTPLRNSTKTKARIVVAPYSLFDSAEYKSKLASPITDSISDWKRKIGTFQFKAKTDKASKGLALESYHWRRIILDEFHELAGDNPVYQSVRTVLRFLQSSMRWGVTGTPEELLRSTGTARRAARIFHVELNAGLSARRFCEQFYRTSTVELDVAVEQKFVPVKHTAQESAIYMNSVRDLNLRLGPRPWGDDELQKLRELLQLCSHFSTDSGPRTMQQATDSVGAAVALHQHKRAAVTRSLQHVEHQCALWERACMVREDAIIPPRGSRPLRVTGLRIKLEDCAQCSRNKAPCPTCVARASREELESAQRQAMAEVRSLQFFDSVWQLATRSRESLYCAVCMENFAPSDGGLLHCGHMFCMTCIQDSLRARRHVCPLCRGPMDDKRLVRIGDLRNEIQKKEPPEGAPAPGPVYISDNISEFTYAGKDCTKYGSKLQAIMWALERVRSEDPEAKVIIFSQWQLLETKISNALSEFGIRHLRLGTCTNIFERRQVLESFQDPTNTDARVLLLSLDGHASGTNLTCASHVFLVHPMLAATGEQQVAYERQAIGRAARLGQKKKVTVWRFLTQGTFEERVANSV